jgi:hypothetical protein
MVVLADEVLESFFETDLSASFRLEPVPDLELPLSNGGLLGDIWSTIATDGNKKMFNKVTDEIGKTIGKHQVRLYTSFCLQRFILTLNADQVIHRPSIGRYTKLEEPKARESLLTPSMRQSPSKTSPSTTSPTVTSSSATLAVDVQQPEMSQVHAPLPPQTPEFSPMPMVHAANAALLERTPFAIDDPEDDDDESDDEFQDTGDDDQVMDEVCVSIGSPYHSSCLMILANRLTRSWKHMTPA